MEACFPPVTYEWPTNFAFALNKRNLKVERDHEFPHIQPTEHVDHVVEVDCIPVVSEETRPRNDKDTYVPPRP